MIFNVPTIPLNTSDNLPEFSVKLKEKVKTVDFKTVKQNTSKKFKVRVDDLFLETWELLNYGIFPDEKVHCLNRALSRDALRLYARNIGVIYKDVPTSVIHNLEINYGINTTVQKHGIYVAPFEFTSEGVSNAVILSGLFAQVVIYVCNCTLKMYLICQDFLGIAPSGPYSAEYPPEVVTFFTDVAAKYSKITGMSEEDWMDTYQIKNSDSVVSIFNFNVRKLKEKDVSVELEYKFKNMVLADMREVYSNIIKNKHDIAITSYVIIMSTEESSSNVKALRLKADLTSKTKHGEIKQRIKNINMGDYTITIASEKKVAYEALAAEVNKNRNKYVRVIYRMSVVQGSWSYDFSHITSTTNVTSTAIKCIQAEMFTMTLTPETFLKDKVGTDVELEVEFIGDVLTDEILNEPLMIIKNDDGYQNALYNVAVLIGRTDADKFRSTLGLKRLVAQVQELDRTQYIDVTQHPENYFISEKKDGIHAVLHAENGVLNIITNRLETVSITSKATILVEGEVVGDTIYLFNVLTSENFSEKIPKFKEYADKLKNKLYKIKTKEFLPYSVKNIEKIPKGEGIIFVNQDSKSYKWKYPEHISIDFLAQHVPKRLCTSEKYMQKDKFAYILLNGINRAMYTRLSLPGYVEYPIYNYSPYPFQQLPVYFGDRDDLHNKIIELKLRRSGKNVVEPYEWELLRVRDDRQVEVDRGNYFGNDYIIAQKIWFTMIYPFDYDALINPNNIDSYFSKESSDVYYAQRRFNSNVKWELYKKTHGELLVDLAAGRGQDINKAFDYFNSALFVDKDIVALEELQRRRLSRPEHKKFTKKDAEIKKNISQATKDSSKHLLEDVKRKHTDKLYSNILAADLNDPYKKNVQAIMDLIPSKADTVMMNFAIHYMIADEASLYNLVNLITNIISDGGKFVFTCFNGERVHKITESSYCNEKYCIKRDYNGGFGESGQLIQVKLPFAKDSFMVEPLVNIEWVIKTFAKRNFKLLERGSFGEYLPQFGKGLDDLDKEYIQLYEFVILEKKKGEKPELTGGAIVPCKLGIVQSSIDYEENPHLEMHPTPLKCFDISELSRIIGANDKREKYVELKLKDQPKTNHWGQRKLLLSEIEFLTLHAEEPGVIIYAGAAPGTHTEYLVSLFPMHTYVLVDPAPFKCRETEQIIIKNEFFTDKLVKLLVKEYGDKPIYFISDVRSTPAEKDIKEDMKKQCTWLRLLSPTYSMLKFRLPWDNKKTKYLKGDVYYQVWAPTMSTECRLMVPKKNNNKYTFYDNRKHEEQLFYFNTHTRVSYYNYSENIPSLGHCYDCAGEFVILKKYLEKYNKPSDDENLNAMVDKITAECGNRGSVRAIISTETRNKWYDTKY